jgi:23S rRNA (uracil1939-C5)-methyltransferase
LELKTLAIVKGQLQTKKYFYSVRRNKSIVLEKVLVEDYAAEGKSLARWEGKVIFIENVVPGDIVDIRLRKNKKDWAEGYPIQFHSYSKQRVQPFCQHFGVCGGCQWQMLPYNLQLVYKQQQVYDNLKRIGKIPLPQFLPIAGAHETKFYRNKLEYTFSTKEYTPEKPNSTTHYNLPIEPIQTQKQVPTQFSPITEVTTRQNQFKQETFNNNNEAGISAPFIAGQTRSPQGDLREAVLGFHAKGFFDKVVNIQKCWLQHEPTNELRNSLRDFAKKK